MPRGRSSKAGVRDVDQSNYNRKTGHRGAAAVFNVRNACLTDCGSCGPLIRLPCIRAGGRGESEGQCARSPTLYSPFQKECLVWRPAAGDQLLLRPMICSADVRPKGCRKIALVSLPRAAWPEAMQSAHARALLPALPWQLMM